MIRYGVFLAFVILLYAGTIGPFTAYLQEKPVEEKIGYVPDAAVLKIVSADQQLFVADSLVLKVLIYFGGLMNRSAKKLVAPPDYRSMHNALTTALKLDPYNIDAYYFSQAVFVWDVGRVREANNILEYGMRYRTWDWYLPFFAGFNYAYFLKDYEKAAEYYQQAAKLTGSPLYQKLAGRYLYEAGQTALAIGYLKTLLRGTVNRAVKRDLLVRLQAFEGVRRIEIARDRFRNERGKLPSSLDELLKGGYLTDIPTDPYGGTFYLEQNGKIATTSRFAFAGRKRGH